MVVYGDLKVAALAWTTNGSFAPRQHEYTAPASPAACVRSGGCGRVSVLCLTTYTTNTCVVNSVHGCLLQVSHPVDVCLPVCR